MHFAVTLFFFFNDPATTEIYTLSLHDALPISRAAARRSGRRWRRGRRVPPARCRRRREIRATSSTRSEEHTSELQSQSNLVCRLLLEKKNTLSYYSGIYMLNLMLSFIAICRPL